jgi:RNA polymerase sigma-70 factor, ECF subfamily
MNDDAPADADIRDMARLAGGEHAALDDLMDRHAVRLVGYLTRQLRDESEAEDLAQETFVRVFQHRDRFDPARKFTTWLYTIATNLMRDRLRRLSRRPEVPLEGPAASGQEPREASIPAPDSGPDGSLLATERAQAVQQAVATLPEDLRTALILFEYEDLSHAEIAAVVECTPKAVETRLYRARAQLRDALKKYLDIL